MGFSRGSRLLCALHTVFGDFDEFFEGAKTFFTPKLSWTWRRAILGHTKAETPSKNLDKSPIMCFASLQKITSQTFKRTCGALVFSCTGAIISSISFPFHVVYIFFRFKDVLKIIMLDKRAWTVRWYVAHRYIKCYSFRYHDTVSLLSIYSKDNLVFWL